MGQKFDFENIRNVRSSKGVYSGCDVTKSAANTLAMTLGRVKFGLTDANITALAGQELNEGGTQGNVSAANLSTAALANGTYVLYLRTDGTLDTTPEAETTLEKGPLVTLNNTGLTDSPNIRTLDTPSIRLCTFVKSAGDVVATSINYDHRETIS